MILSRKCLNIVVSPYTLSERFFHGANRSQGYHVSKADVPRKKVAKMVPGGMVVSPHVVARNRQQKNVAFRGRGKGQKVRPSKRGQGRES